ncbi:hypothetical protein BCR33DRAFT_716541 [Rhizoclosmatium globosum]|uniref:Uncharacterized protein n=1 Tax=Rhizoclosmatium globosum TaxID=329046 RepID=A0A1Y2CDV7_9FUNG|nr:hypothetical protein BCR33DRAFT_716541 [Rhizoclosmatium globosum]|eukprot:ORY45250.1 hypothetical protein BCR33DRAFT_716541 [Rhizoclosmatium globosum]
MIRKRRKGFKTHRPTPLGIPDPNTEEAKELRRSILSNGGSWHRTNAAASKAAKVYCIYS